MQTTRYWQVLLQEQIPDIYKDLLQADKIKNENYNDSAVNSRKFLEAIVALMLEYESLIKNRKEIKPLGLSNGISKLRKIKNIKKPQKPNEPENILIKIDDIRVIGNEGAHPFTDVTKEQLENMFTLTKEIAQYFTDNYIDKIVKEKPRLEPQQIKLPEIQENETYIFECLKPECKREVRDKRHIKVCKKCGGPVKFKDIDANYMNYDIKLVKPLISNIPTFRPSTNSSNKVEPSVIDFNKVEEINILKKHKIEIYNSSLELIKEVVLNKDKIVVGRSSSTTTVDIDLSSVANDKNGNCLISREHVYITKSGEDYFVENASSKSSVQVNNNKIEYNKALIRLQNNDVVILNNFIALVYRVA